MWGAVGNGRAREATLLGSPPERGLGHLYQMVQRRIPPSCVQQSATDSHAIVDYAAASAMTRLAGRSSRLSSTKRHPVVSNQAFTSSTLFMHHVRHHREISEHDHTRGRRFPSGAASHDPALF